MLTTAWTKITGKEPPQNPEDPEVGWAEAMGWAAMMGVAVSIARLLATRLVHRQANTPAVETAEKAEESRIAELRGYLDFTRKYAQGHRDVIRQFGRFPYRNAVLGRESTPEEKAWVPGEFSGG